LNHFLKSTFHDENISRHNKTLSTKTLLEKGSLWPIMKMAAKKLLTTDYLRVIWARIWVIVGSLGRLGQL